jgi:RNA polymerase sigma-70 factor (ECF subfamily)
VNPVDDNLAGFACEDTGKPHAGRRNPVEFSSVRRLLRAWSVEATMTSTRARNAAVQLDFERQVLRHRRELLAAATRLTGSRAEAEDLVQDAVLRAWVFWHRFEPGTNGRAWVHRILLNTFLSRYRRRRREREVLAVAADDVSFCLSERPSSAREPGEGLGDEVLSALEALPEPFRRVVVLVDLEEQSYRDAASALGCPIGTVMSRLHRARRAMREKLEKYATSQGYLSEAA